MAAPIADKVVLPLDTGNTGKKKRTQTRVIGADTVHEDFVIPYNGRVTTGLYYATPGKITFPTSAHNVTATAYAYLYNPVGSTIKMAVRRLAIQTQWVITTAVDVTTPRQAVSLFTFSGVGSGALILAAKRDSADASPQGNLRTAVTGLTVTLGNMIKFDLPSVNATASSATIQANFAPATASEWDPPTEEQIILRAGEGIAFWSADAATTANRNFSCDIIWEEFE